MPPDHRCIILPKALIRRQIRSLFVFFGMQRSLALRWGPEWALRGVGSTIHNESWVSGCVWSCRTHPRCHSWFHQVFAAFKQAQRKSWLPKKVQKTFRALIIDLEASGPIQGTWKNYSKLSSVNHHCHIKTGRPTYVVCWEVKNKRILLKNMVLKVLLISPGAPAFL